MFIYWNQCCKQTSLCLESCSAHWTCPITSCASIETLLEPPVSFSPLQLRPDKNVAPGQFERDWNEARIGGGVLESYRHTRQSVSLTGNFRDNCSTDSSAIGAWRHERSHINDSGAPRPLEAVLLNGQELQIPNQKRQCDTGAKAEALRRW